MNVTRIFLGVIVWSVSFTQALEIEHSMIVTLTTDAPVNVIFKNGDTQVGRLTKQEDGLFSVSDNERNVLFQADQLASN